MTFKLRKSLENTLLAIAGSLILLSAPSPCKAAEEITNLPEKSYTFQIPSKEGEKQRYFLTPEKKILPKKENELLQEKYHVQQKELINSFSFEEDLMNEKKSKQKYFLMPEEEKYKFAKDWTWKDTAWEVGLAIVGAIDTIQTYEFLKKGKVVTKKTKEKTYYSESYESNPLLGSHPSNEKLIAFAVGGIAIHAIIAAALKPEYEIELFGVKYSIPARRLFQGLSIASECSTIANNANIGWEYHW